MTLSRRNMLKSGAGAVGLAVAAPLLSLYAKPALGRTRIGYGYGALRPKLPLNAAELTQTVVGDLSREALLALPDGFNYRVLSMTGMPMSDGSLVPAGHDGMAAFAGPGNTTVLVRNHELSTSLPTTYNYPVQGFPRYSAGALGGTTTLVVGPNRELQRDFVSLAGTRTNCAGGPTPWGSWISCEETFSTTTSGGATVRHGYNFEVPADADGGIVTPLPLPAMGRFSHEAIAVDPATGWIYETEDRGDSCFYRFVPTVPGQPRLGGALYALKVKGAGNFTLNTTNNASQGGTPGRVRIGQPLDVEWVLIDKPDPDAEGVYSDAAFAANGVSVRQQAQRKGAAVFFRGEGCWYGNGLVYFVATQAGPTATANLPPGNGRGNGQVYAYDPQFETLTLIVEAPVDGGTLDEPDNVVVTPWGDLLLCEDSSDDFQYLVGVTPDGGLYQFAQNVLFAQATSDPAKASFIGNEFAGACFDPDGRTLYVNVQTPGLTFAIWGPWNSRRG